MSELRDVAEHILATLAKDCALEHDRWVAIRVERVFFIDHGRNVILCDCLPRHARLLLKNPSSIEP